MGLFDFLFHREPQKRRRRRSSTGPFEGLKSDVASKPLPSLKTPSRLVSKTPSGSSGSFDSGSVDMAPQGESSSVVPAGFPDTPHFRFVNLALREATFDKPAVVCGKLTSTEAKTLLQALLDAPATRTSQHSEQVATQSLNFGIDDIRLHKMRAGRYACVVIEMPEPRENREAYFAGILMIGAEHAADALRFFTLEKAPTEAEPDRTALCEWTPSGRRRSFGAGPPPTLDRFVHTLSGMTR